MIQKNRPLVCIGLNKNQIIDLLMGTELYGKPEVALRELIQNSIDACLVRERLSKVWGEEYTPQIQVSFYSKDNVDYLEIYDNGIGMDQYIIDNFYSNVGSSFYKSREFYELMSDANIHYKPISRFGIGILSCFMVSDSLEVDTKRVIGKYKYAEPLKVIVEGYDSIFYIKQGERQEPGTTTVLQLRKVHPWKRMSNNEFKKFVKTVVKYPPFEIEICSNNQIEKHDASKFLQLSPASLKTYTWKSDDNIEEIIINISDSEYGFTGAAIVGFLVKNGHPVDKIEVAIKEVEVEGKKYDMAMNIRYSDGEIIKSSQSIGIDDEGNISESTSRSTILKSKSSFSIHGIEFPKNLFPDYFESSKSVLRWPFPILMVLDLGGNGDLNLNSARTEIIFDSKWIEFEERLLRIVCIQLAEKMGIKRWSILKQIIIKQTKKQELVAVINDI